MMEFGKKRDQALTSDRPKAPRIHGSPSWKATVYVGRLTDYSLRVPILKTILLLLAPLLLNACSLLFGNIAAVSEKSGRYEAASLPSEWESLSPTEIGEAAPDDPDQNSRSDFAFQSAKTSSIISVNSACRPSLDWDELVPEEKRKIENKNQLRNFTRQLLMGIEPSSPPTERELSVSDLSAMETTLAGSLSGKETRVRTVVVRRKDCIYDLMYVAQPPHFDADVEVFDRFVASFKVRR